MKKGFTLVELLVVIAIIGLLAGIVAVSVSSARVKARDSVRKADVADISLSAELFYDDQTDPSYPLAATWGTDLDDYIQGGVMPTDPSDGSDYVYTNPTSDGASYQVCATLEKDSSQFCKTNQGAQ